MAWLLETTTHVKYWDYSNFRFNLKGRICLWVALGKAELTDKLEPKVEAARQKYYAEIARLERSSRRFHSRYSRMSFSRHYSIRREDIVAAAQLAREELLRKKRTGQ